MMVKIKQSDIRRHGNRIRLGQGRTAIEGGEGNLDALEIREHGKKINWMRGSSLRFSENLTDEDRTYLACLGSD